VRLGSILGLLGRLAFAIYQAWMGNCGGKSRGVGTVSTAGLLPLRCGLAEPGASFLEAQLQAELDGARAARS
jgi:hypothetical protein